MCDTNTDYLHNLPYLRGIAGKVLRRLKAAGPNSSHELEDVLAELSIPYIKACNAYDPSLGVPFKPFLARGCYQYVNQWIEKEIQSASGAHLSLDRDFDNGDNDGGNLHAILPSADPAADEILEENERYEHGMALVRAKLSPRAQQFVELITRPPEGLIDAFVAIKARSVHARERGIASSAPQQLSGAIVFELMGAGLRERGAIYREIRGLAAKVGH